jgi:site-specific recombinase XerD
VPSPRRSVAPEPDLAVLLPSWELHLRAERKSPQTVKTYGDGVRRYLGYCADEGLSTLDRTSLASFIAALLDGGAEPATARSRHLAVRRFTTWLLEEGEIDYDPFLGLRPPKLDVRVVEPLSDDQLRALLKACAGTEFRDRRDEAVLRLTATHTRSGWLSRHVRWLSTGVPGVEPG